MRWDDLTESERGWIAGFLDGEGSISIHRHGTVYFRLTIAFYNSHKKAMDWVASKLEFLSQRRREDKRIDDRHKKINYGIWIQNSQDCLDFLLAIKPYLKIKKYQAELGIKFIREVINRKAYRYTPSLIKNMETMWKEMRVLNGSNDKHLRRKANETR